MTMLQSTALPSNLNKSTLAIMAQARGAAGIALVASMGRSTIDKKYSALLELPVVGMPDTTNPSVQAEIARLKAENRDLRAGFRAERRMEALARPLRCKVSDKGAVSVYGLGRFPVTLYREQMTKLLAHAELIRAFMVENASKLSSKPTEAAAE